VPAVDAAYAAIANLIILFCFVWEMEATRTPSALAKISFWSMILMVGADAWLFSAVSSFTACTVLPQQMAYRCVFSTRL
jgi:hypothetical protein